MYGKPQFQGIRSAASHVGRGAGEYQEDMFFQDFPQFYTKGAQIPLYPHMAELIRQANAAIQPDQWLENWRYACGLYVAHYATLFLRTYSEGSETPAEAAATGALVGVVSSAKLGQNSVTYDTNALTKATADWGDLNATVYGQQLASRARLAGMGGCYVL